MGGKGLDEIVRVGIAAWYVTRWSARCV